MERINEILKEMIETRVICGASWAFVSGEGFELHCRGRRGAIEPYCREELLPGMYYDLASLSKVVGTTSRILQMVEAGVLCLDTPVCRILLDFRYPEVTAANLLLHNSGLMAEVIDKEHLTAETIVRRVYETPQLFPCGEKFVYSDTGFILLGLIIQALDETTLEESLRDHVPLEPLSPRGREEPWLTDFRRTRSSKTVIWWWLTSASCTTVTAPI